MTTPGAALYNESHPNQKKITVPTTTLDMYVEAQGLTRVNLVKLDIEGAEMLALSGMRHLLRVHRPTVIVELVGPKRIQEGLEFFEGINYRCFELNRFSYFFYFDGVDAINLLAIPSSLAEFTAPQELITEESD